MFPDLRNKKFIDISTNKPVFVKNQFENIAILEDDQRIDVKKLMDKNYYDDYIDPSTFFSQSNLQVFADKIKSIPNETLQKMKDDTSESIVIEYDPEDEKRALEKKAKEMYSTNSNAAISQIEKFKNLIDEDEMGELSTNTVVTNEPIKSQPTPIRQHPIQPTQQPLMDPPQDPMITMFKNIKKNTDFKISIDIDNKIPRPDFIEMMEDSYEVSIIDYLAKEFTKNIISDTSMIENKIKDAIKNIVYKKEEKAEDPIVKKEDKTPSTKPRRKKLNNSTESLKNKTE